MTKAAILIDGGYFLNRLPTVRSDVNVADADEVAESIMQLIRGHLTQLNKVDKAPNILGLLYRGFYYDAMPYVGKIHTPVGKVLVDFGKTPQARFRTRLFEALHHKPNLAVRLGEVRKSPQHSWTLRPKSQKAIMNGQSTVDDLTDSDFAAALRQKGVDMRIGIDIAAITLKRQANVIVLVSGDADFVPAANFARREGIQFILDPLWQNVSVDLSRHIDGLRSGFYLPKSGDGRSPDS